MTYIGSHDAYTELFNTILSLSDKNQFAVVT